MSTAQTYYRVQEPTRPAEDLLDPEWQQSHAWHREGLTRQGISVCESREELATYLASAGEGIPFGQPDWVLVELTGEPSDDTPLDREHGERLIHPTAVLSVAEIDDAFFEMIGAAYDEMED